MIDFDCQFCDKPTVNANLEEMSRYGVYVQFCHTCLAEYVFYRDETLSHYSLYTTLGEKMYRWTIAHSVAFIRYVEKPGIPGQVPNKDMRVVHRFANDIPEITPQNINEKLKTYLVFL